MILEIGKRYRTVGSARVHKVVGFTHSRKDVVFTSEGAWFEQATGRSVRYYEHLPKESTCHDLSIVVTPHDSGALTRWAGRMADFRTMYQAEEAMVAALNLQNTRRDT